MSNARSPRAVCSMTIGTMVFICVSMRSLIVVSSTQVSSPALVVRFRLRAIISSRRRLVLFAGAQQIGRGDRLVRHLGHLDYEIDHLVLEQRGPQLRQGFGVVAIEI